MQIPLVDLEAQYLNIADEIQAAIAETLRRNDYILGEGVQRFEGEFAEFSGVPHCIGVGRDHALVSAAALSVSAATLLGGGNAPAMAGGKSISMRTILINSSRMSLRWVTRSSIP